MNVRPLTPCELHPEQREQEEIPFRCTFNKVIPALFTRRTVAVFARGFWFELQHRTCVWLKSLMHFKKRASVWYMVMVTCACTLLKPQIYRHDTHTHIHFKVHQCRTNEKHLSPQQKKPQLVVMPDWFLLSGRWREMMRIIKWLNLSPSYLPLWK